MSLLQWCTLRPQGPSNLAAIRFSAPIHISSLKVFPNGAKPFKEAPDVVAETQPEAFFLNIYFNAQPLHPNVDKEKQRAPNALIPTSIAYAGGQMEFPMDMGSEYATRLMIIKGNFEVLSLAIYGRVVSPEQEAASTYEPQTLPTPLEPYPLSTALDVASASEPKELAEKLLTLMNVNPPLPLIIRLMFCLKPSEDDWDDPDFPYLYADLDDKDSDFDLEGVVSSLSRPVRDDLSKDEFMTLVERINDFLGPKDNDQAYYLAKLLSIAAPQPPEMARSILENVDVDAFFDATTLEDENTLLCLLDACANRDVAKHLLGKQFFLEALGQLQRDVQTDEYIKSAAKKVEKTIHSWRTLEDALTNDDANFQEAIEFVLEVTSEENSTGVWLSCMLASDDIAEKISNVKPDVPQLPLGLAPATPPKTSAEFATLIRAFVGILCVLSAWAWADSLGVDECRERILAVLSLWQDIDGYREILNHLLHLRQLTRRLGWIIADSNPPRKSGIFAERLLVRLTDEPSSILQEELYKAILDLKQPLSYITDDERKAMVKVALVAEDGLPAAVEELLFTSDRPLSFRRLRALRVSMAIIHRELKDGGADKDEDGVIKVLQSLWQVDSHGFVPRLVELLRDVTDDIASHFGGEAELDPSAKLLSQLFDTAKDILGLIKPTAAGYPLTSRYLRTLTTSIADLCTCCTLARDVYAPTSMVGKAARPLAADGVNILSGLVAEDMKTEAGMLNALVVLRALLGHGGQCEPAIDPVYHIRQVLAIVDQLLPQPGYQTDDAMYEDDQPPSYWNSLVVPKVLHELKEFFQLLDLEDRTSLFRRLRALDQGLVGVGEWLLGEELKLLHEAALDLDTESEGPHQEFLKNQVVESVDFLWRLIDKDSSGWLDEVLQSDESVASLLQQALDTLLNAHLTTPLLGQLVQALAKRRDSLSTFGLRHAILLQLLRNAQLRPSAPGILDDFVPLLQQLPSTAISTDSFPLEVGLALASFAKQDAAITRESCIILVNLLECIQQQQDKRLTTLRGITAEQFSTLTNLLLEAVPEKEAIISDARTRVTIDEDEVFVPSIVELESGAMVLPLGSIEELLTPTTKDRDDDGRPKTPTKRAGYKTPDILGTVISPPTALLRSPAATGLTKTYNANDFRQLRQVPSARLNTSRLPSMHGA
ncbi:hypothetical protein BKA70DRAFT_1093863 [Coprinopsis sp. MPI-PUGE-AT-0042]|nr:hypothetical protein BKA70DRAFT_1093863 [Coprinopsis sp. MPI-PUGE-AT-0042]